MLLFVTRFQKDSVISFMLLKYKELEEVKSHQSPPYQYAPFPSNNYQGQQT